MAEKKQAPPPLFDSVQYIAKQSDFSYLDERYLLADLQQGLAFLKAYKGSQGTFNSYRREIERLLHWCATISNKHLDALGREDMEHYLEFCQNPPKHWIGTNKPPKFIVRDGARIPNQTWRPFIAKLSKAARRRGAGEDDKHFELSQGSLREVFAILSSFFNFLLQEEYIGLNPVLLIRQKSQFIRKSQGQAKIRRLSELQWHYVIKTVQALAEHDPEKHERSLFIMSALYSMYLRISELVASERWTPLMNDFFKDNDGQWWFITVGKGNKERQIAVSDAMLASLKRWRACLNLSPLPSPADTSPLLPKSRGHGAIKSANYIRDVVQFCFDQAIEQLKQDGLAEESETLNEATVHWLRHTGISDDVKHRPREHVRDDAGHSSSATTDRYIDIELRERHLSAKKKAILDDDIAGT